VIPRRAAPQRYQLSKRALAVVASGHPWIFRGLTSSALAAFADGQWLALYDGGNQVVGHGVYAAEGAIAIRVVSRGPIRPRGRDFAARIDRALAARARLRAETDGFRAIAGESDGLPAVVVDVLGPAVVAQAYAAGFDALARLAAARVARAVGAAGVVVRVPTRRFGAAAGPRVARRRGARRGRGPRGPAGLRRQSESRTEDRGLPRPARAAALGARGPPRRRARAQPVRVHRHDRPRRRARRGRARSRRSIATARPWPSPPPTTSASPRAIASSPPTSSRTCPRPPSPTSWSSSIRRR
jgi:hypothetical protein